LTICSKLPYDNGYLSCLSRPTTYIASQSPHPSIHPINCPLSLLCTPFSSLTFTRSRTALTFVSSCKTLPRNRLYLTPTPYWLSYTECSHHDTPPLCSSRRASQRPNPVCRSRHPHSPRLRHKLWLLSMGALFRRASQPIGD
jgi:hypothetical protein